MKLHCVWRQKFCECYSSNLSANKYFSLIYLLGHQSCFLGENNVESGKVTLGYFLEAKRCGYLGEISFLSFFFFDKSHSEVQQEKQANKKKISLQYRGKLCRRRVDIGDQIISKEITDS